MIQLLGMETSGVTWRDSVDNDECSCWEVDDSEYVLWKCIKYADMRREHISKMSNEGGSPLLSKENFQLFAKFARELLMVKELTEELEEDTWSSSIRMRKSASRKIERRWWLAVTL